MNLKAVYLIDNEAIYCKDEDVDSVRAVLQGKALKASVYAVETLDIGSRLNGELSITIRTIGGTIGKIIYGGSYAVLNF